MSSAVHSPTDGRSAGAPAGGPSSPRRAGAPRGWTTPQVVLAFALSALGVLVTWDAWADIARIAMRDDEASQVMLAPVVAAWLLWVRRARLRRYVPRATWAGPAIIALGWALHRTGDTHLIQSFWHFGAVLVAVGGFLTVAGGRFLLHFMPVFAALCFLVPVPGRVRQAIAIPLQAATAELTQNVLELMGAGVERHGNMLTIGGEEVLVAEACNGLRMVFALVITSFAFAFATPLRNSIRVLIIVASPITAILLNVVRLIPTVWAFSAFSAEAAVSFHDITAWFMLPLAFFSLLGLIRVLRWAQIPVTPYMLAYGS